jgi:hypothetical protein
VGVIHVVFFLLLNAQLKLVISVCIGTEIALWTIVLGCAGQTRVNAADLEENISDRVNTVESLIPHQILDESDPRC